MIQPTSRYATAAAVVDDAIYVIGGIERAPDGDETVAVVEAYDPDASTWSRCSPMPTPRSFAAAAAFDGRVYVFGGLDQHGDALDTVEVYEPQTDAWSACPPMDTPLSRLAAVSHMRLGVIVAGGIDASGKTSGRQRIYLPREGHLWRDWRPALLSARHGFGLVDADDGTERLFAIGGYGEDGPMAAVEWWGVGTVGVLDDDGDRLRPFVETVTDSRTGETRTVDSDYEGYLWQHAPPLDVARGFHGVAKIGGRIYAVGGRCVEVPDTEFLDIDSVSAGWQQAAPLPKDLCRFSLVAWNGHLFAIGGETDFGAAINADVLEYDPAKDAWSVR